MDKMKQDMILSAPINEILGGVTALGIYITDTDRKIIYWNPTAERITGYPREMVLGRSCKDNILCHNDRHGRNLCESTVCPLNLCMVNDSARSLATFVFAKKRDGTRVPVDVTVSPIHDRNGKVIGGIEIFREAESEAFQAKLAEEVQKALFPDPKVIAAQAHIGYSFCLADTAGGDMFCCFPARDGRVAGVILDICGHGVASALLAAFMRSSVLELREKLVQQPSDILRFLVSKRAGLAIRLNNFSALAFVYDPKTMALTLSRAGHPFPVIVDADGKGSVLELEGESPIGYFDDMDFKDIPVDFQGKRLVLYSDGILESRSPGGEELDQAGIITLLEHTAALAPEACAKKLVDYAFAFAGTGNPVDDMMAIVLDGKPL